MLIKIHAFSLKKNALENVIWVMGWYGMHFVGLNSDLYPNSATAVL